ncbi:hypothetical protein MP228_003754 [Amoeboaphelidium protococcarum]|nr:hypothetical protein MP228_005003 [Amoeboaphelidium protococcarum]KAI3651412.1 hypothetical protein MP228_003754 [Amoeboaphelidium protococcarum]
MKYFYNAFHDGNQFRLGTALENELGVYAEQTIRAGTVLKGLIGFRNAMAADKTSEVAKKNQRNFYVNMVGVNDVFDGPTYFLNHSCRPNLICSSMPGKEFRFKATRNIAVGEELTISYSKQYFLGNKLKCKCEHCR